MYYIASDPSKSFINRNQHIYFISISCHIFHIHCYNQNNSSRYRYDMYHFFLLQNPASGQNQHMQLFVSRAKSLEYSECSSIFYKEAATIPSCLCCSEMVHLCLLSPWIHLDYSEISTLIIHLTIPGLDQVSCYHQGELLIDISFY